MRKSGMKVSSELQHWYQKIKRDLPWRAAPEAYNVWLSEVILQQTRVDQGLDYYYKFLHAFPRIHDLANAPEDAVLKLWQGLGYYSRARNLHKAAKQVMTQHNGVFPKTYKEILALPGVGPYTAAAISSICYGLPHAVVDGNVYRVLSRLYGIDTPIDVTAGQKAFKALAQDLLDTQNPGDHNQAMMEFGALQCTPTKPDCGNCILRQQCEARKQNRVAELPVKAKKLAKRDRYFNYLVTDSDSGFYIRKRTGKGIWQGLYEFPLVELTGDAPNATALQSSPEYQQLIGATEVTVVSVSEPYKHILSHQRIFARFWRLRASAFPALGAAPEFLHIGTANLEQYAIPKLIDNYLRDTEL